MMPHQKVRALRKERGMTQRQAGDAIGVHFATINKIETGKMRLSADQMVRFAQLFEVPLSEFADVSTAEKQAQDASEFLSQQIAKRLSALGYSDRQASLMATDKPDLIRHIKNRRVMPGAMALLALSRVLQTDMHWLLDQEYVEQGTMRGGQLSGNSG